MDHWQLAQKNLLKAEDSPGGGSTCGLAGIATAHAVLALLDYLQQDDTQEASELQTQQEYIRHLGRRIVALEEDLEGARAALRACDDALNTEMKAAAADD